MRFEVSEQQFAMDKESRYREMLSAIAAITEKETNIIANLANITAVIKEFFGFLWVGFYFVENGELILGVFQGPPACTRIAYGKGVCGKAWEEQRTIIVADVEKFPGHIACSSKSKSEIVVPVFKDGKITMLLDIDSDKLNTFDDIDRQYLEELVKIIIE